MRNVNNKSGFTLIEIIVVLIIVGILAAIALPNLFSNIAKSRSGQAIAVLDGLKSTLETCMAGPSNSAVIPGSAPCTTAALAPAAITSSGVTWTFTIPTAAVVQTGALGTVNAPAAGANGTWQGSVVATDNQATPNSIVFNRANTGVWSCSLGSTSTYLGVC